VILARIIYYRAGEGYASASFTGYRFDGVRAGGDGHDFVVSSILHFVSPKLNLIVT
jgi:hypothetical protein